MDIIDSTTIADIVQFIVAVAGLLAGVTGWWRARAARAEADAATVTAGAAAVTAGAAAEKTHVDALVETVQAMSNECQRLRACIEELGADYQILEAGRLADRERIAELEARLVEVRAALAEAQAENRSLRGENAHWKARVRTLETELDALRQRVENGGSG